MPGKLGTRWRPRPAGWPHPDERGPHPTRVLARRAFRQSGYEGEVLEVEVGQRLANLSGRVSGYLVAVSVKHIDEGRDDVTALIEVESLHLVQDLFPQRRVAAERDPARDANFRLQLGRLHHPGLHRCA